MIWSTENSFKENILNVFKIEALQSQYTENNQDVIEKTPDDVNYCFICYDQLDTTTKKQTKTCVNEKCDSLYHMACICEVRKLIFFILVTKIRKKIAFSL